MNIIREPTTSSSEEAQTEKNAYITKNTKKIILAILLIILTCLGMVSTVLGWTTFNSNEEQDKKLILEILRLLVTKEPTTTETPSP